MALSNWFRGMPVSQKCLFKAVGWKWLDQSG